MSLPSILDVLDAVLRVSNGTPEVRAWWLTPHARLPLAGDRRGRSSSARRIALAVECAKDAELDCGALERELTVLLPGCAVTVRPLGDHEEMTGMMRLVHLETAPAMAVGGQAAEPGSSANSNPSGLPVREERAVDAPSPQVGS
ncbi:MAG: hypothetical protein ABTD50_09360 [Polyangiaceae bacterium]|jgi:hypothetical protein